MWKERPVGPIVLVGLLTLVYSPALVWLVRSWLSNEYYGHGFVIPLVSGFFVWRKRRELQRRERSAIGVGVLILGLLLYIIGILLSDPVFLCLSLVVVLAALTLHICGDRALRSVAFPIVFLLFMIPPPFLTGLTQEVLKVATHGSAALVEALGVEVTTTGAEIALEDAAFTVGLPCSGMRSLVALLAVAAVLTYLARGSWIKRTILFVSAVPLAIFTNILRISALLLIADRWGQDAATGLTHDLMSPAAFVLAVVLLIVESLLLRLKFGENEEQEDNMATEEIIGGNV
jgi:exosortase